MAGDKAKAAAGRKAKDKWKMKEWYNVHAPRMFNETVIGETPASDPELLIGRQAEVTVGDLTGDLSKAQIKLKFKIVGSDGHEAKTEFIGHDLTSDYVRRLTRRKKTKTDHVVDVFTSDGFKIRLKTMSIADRRIQASQEDGMRAHIGAYLTQFAAEHTLADIIKVIISGDMAKDTAKACHPIIPIKRIEIRKSEVLSRGDAEPESILPEDKPEDSEAPAKEETVEAPEEAPAEAEAKAEETAE